jgi:hypothetical protein
MDEAKAQCHPQASQRIAARVPGRSGAPRAERGGAEGGRGFDLAAHPVIKGHVTDIGYQVATSAQLYPKPNPVELLIRWIRKLRSMKCPTGCNLCPNARGVGRVCPIDG